MTWLRYVNLSDEYERRARFLPGVLTVIPLFPTLLTAGSGILDLKTLLLGGVGIGAVVSVGLSHLASAMGNRIQLILWPQWPHDSPTNRWLHPSENETSGQQKRIWYRAIKRLVSIDIQAAIDSGESIETTINDAVVALRHLFNGEEKAERLRRSNLDYGFARNLVGLRSVWGSFLVLSTAVTWLAHWTSSKGSLEMAVVSTVLAIVLLPCAIYVLPSYVRIKAQYYAESFFGTLTAVDENASNAYKGGQW